MAEPAEAQQFESIRMRGSTFREVDLSGARFDKVYLMDSQFRGVMFGHVRMRGVELADVDITGEIQNLTINGVDVAPLVAAELERRNPDLAKMRPSDPAGFREAWDLLEGLWGRTVERARGLDPDLLHESVHEEWSFIETLRHLAFATDAWVRRGILGDPAPWDPLDLPWDEMDDTPGVPRDRKVRPSLDTVLELRHDRVAGVRDYLARLTDESLAADTTPVEGPGWPESKSYPVRECLLIVLNEEWWHRQFAERDLDALEKRTGTAGAVGKAT
jgi:DinB superfamily/Pentapeptide repeats (9 copies)